MKFIANPVEVDAWPITDVGALQPDGSRRLLVGGANPVSTEPSLAGIVADAGMLARLTNLAPIVGDYVVKQADGYIYLNPKHVFERKYRPDDDPSGGVMQAIRGAVARGWCDPKNSSKEFDGDLAEAISVEVSNLRRYLVAKPEPNARELGAMVRAAGLAGE